MGTQLPLLFTNPLLEMCCFSYLTSKSKNFCLGIWHRRCKRLLRGRAQMASLQAICSRVTAARVCWGQPQACLSLDNEEKVWNVSYINWAIKDGGRLWPWPLTSGWKTKFLFLHLKRHESKQQLKWNICKAFPIWGWLKGWMTQLPWLIKL